MTNFNRRMFMSLAGIAAAEPAMSLLERDPAPWWLVRRDMG